MIPIESFILLRSISDPYYTLKAMPKTNYKNYCWYLDYKETSF